MAVSALREAEIAARLDELFEVEFTFLHTEALAQALAAQAAEAQRYLLDWTARVASTNIQLAWEFLSRAISRLQELDRAVIEAWALYAMDRYDLAGLREAMLVIRDLDGFLATCYARAHGAQLARIEPVLLFFVHGLAGRRLHLAESDTQRPWTDSETLYLPPLLASLPDSTSNFALYKAMAAMLWAQIHQRSLNREIIQVLCTEPALLPLYSMMDTLRLEARIRAELPGLGRAMQRIRGQSGYPPLPEAWRALSAQLSEPACGAEQILTLARQWQGRLPDLPELPWQGELRPAVVAAATAVRLEREKLSLRVWLREILEAQQPTALQQETPPRLMVRVPEEVEPQAGGEMDLLLDDIPLAPPEAVRQLLGSIQLDLGQIPAEYLHPAGPGEYDPLRAGREETDPDAVWQGTYHEEGAWFYDEWDYGRQHYRKNWCVVREKPVSPVYDSFVADTLARYSGLLKQLRTTFEAMREQDCVHKRQADGDEVDLDALVEALADSRHGGGFSERLYTRMQRSERNIAVIFMVDMSGSTKGWINQAQREALVLLCEALERLGDRYAIYGFSGTTRKRCEIYTVKTLDEDYDSEVRARISGIRPQDYTRMGFAIRHLTRLLRETDARTRLLVTLSDGKPDDYSDYRGEYGIEDTRRALLESRRDGIHPYCITIDEHGGDYLPHMYGPAAYTVVSEVRALPFKLSSIYRQLTRSR